MEQNKLKKWPVTKYFQGFPNRLQLPFLALPRTILKPEKKEKTRKPKRAKDGEPDEPEDESEGEPDPTPKAKGSRAPRSRGKADPKAKAKGRKNQWIAGFSLRMFAMWKP